MYQIQADEIHWLTRRIEYLTKKDQIFQDNPNFFEDLINEQMKPLMNEYSDVCYRKDFLEKISNLSCPLADTLGML